MSQFDQTTERKAVEYDARFGDEKAHFTAGRNSAKESLEILARAAEAMFAVYTPFTHCEHDLAKAIAAVKARGDWPLEEV